MLRIVCFLQRSSLNCSRVEGKKRKKAYNFPSAERQGSFRVQNTVFNIGAPIAMSLITIVATENTSERIFNTSIVVASQCCIHCSRLLLLYCRDVFQSREISNKTRFTAPQSQFASLRYTTKTTIYSVNLTTKRMTKGLVNCFNYKNRFLYIVTEKTTAYA